jgi:hypothetical protein
MAAIHGYSFTSVSVPPTILEVLFTPHLHPADDDEFEDDGADVTGAITNKNQYDSIQTLKDYEEEEKCVQGNKI